MVTAASAEQSGGEQPAVVYSHSAGTVSAACLAMQSRGSAYLFYGHVGQLLSGEELAAAGLEEALGYVERDIEMRLDTEFYVVRGREGLRRHRRPVGVGHLGLRAAGVHGGGRGADGRLHAPHGGGAALRHGPVRGHLCPRPHPDGGGGGTTTWPPTATPC